MDSLALPRVHSQFILKLCDLDGRKHISLIVIVFFQLSMGIDKRGINLG